MGTKNATSTATQSLPGYLNSAYQNVIGQAQNTASQPYTPYTGGFTQDQQTAFQNIGGLWNSSAPQFNAANSALNASQTPTYANVNNYMSPYMNSVVQSTMANMQEQNAQQQQGVIGNAISKGAWGGNRVGVAQAELARQQKLADNQTIAGLYNQGYQGALGAAQADKSAQLQAAGQYAGLGQTQMQTGLAQTAAQLGAGTQQQQFDYQQYLNKLAFPYQQQSWLAGIVGGLGPSAGGTTTETKPQGNIFSQLLGAGLGMASLFKNGGVVPHAAAGGVMPYANDNGGWPSYASGFGGSPYANDNGLFPSYMPQAAQIGGGGRGFPTISPDQQEEDIFGKHAGVLKKGAGNIKSWMTPQSEGLGPLYASGGVVSHMANGGEPRYPGPAGTRNRADYSGFGGYGGPPPLPRDDADMTVPRRNPVKDPGLIAATWAALDAAGMPPEEFPTANSATIGRSPQGGLVASYASEPTPAVVADAGFNPEATLSPANVERYAPESGVIDVSGAAPTGVVPYARGEQFVTTPTPGYSQNIGEAWSSLAGGKGLNLSPDMRQALLAAGMGMMASKSPFALQGIGEGGLEGINAWNARQGIERENAATRANIGQTGQQLATQAQQTAANIGLLGAQTGATRYEATRTPAGLWIRDVMAGNDPGQFYPWGSVLPDGTTANPADVSVETGGSEPLFNTSAPKADINPLLMSPETVPIATGETNAALEKARPEAQNAISTQQMLQEMRHNLSQLPEEGWLVQGTGFPERVAWARGVNTALQGMGLDPYFDEKQVAAGEDLNKLTTRLGFDLSRTLGSDNAAAIVTQSIYSVPGGANSIEGAERIIGGLDAANRRRIDYYNFLQKWAANNYGSVSGADAYFNAINPPELYALSAYVPLEAMQDLAAHPETRDDFNAMFGNGKDVARYVLGQ